MSSTYDRTRARLETYFDQDAARVWERLTSDAPVSRIRRTVRAGRDAMRAELLSHLPDDLSGARVLDAGCGAGQLSAALAARGARVVGVDIAGNLLDVARRRLPAGLSPFVEFHTGDMLDPGFGRFDYAVAMDSLIHYRAGDITQSLERLSSRVEDAIVFTVAPSTLLLQAMFAAGKAFPRSDRSPRIVPIAPKKLAAMASDRLGWQVTPRGRINSGFYISQAMEARKP